MGLFRLHYMYVFLVKHKKMWYEWLFDRTGELLQALALQDEYGF